MVAQQPPRVLVLIKGLGIGGAEKLISEGAQYWDRSRFDYRVAYVLPWKNQLVGEIQALGIPVDCIGGSSGNAAIAALQLKRVIRDASVDLIHAHLPMTGLLARSTNVPVVYTEHNLADSYRQPTKSLNRFTYKRNSAVIAVSDAVADSLKSFKAPNLRVIPNGVSVAADSEAVSAVRKELGVGSADPLVVHVGNIRPHKGHDNLIAMAGKLRASLPSVTVVSIGAEKFPGGLEDVRRKAAESGVDDLLRFLGRRSDALAFTAAADVFVNPSDVEGLPVSILEALALGIPVVATNVGGVGTVVRHEETGILVPPRDPSALAAGVERLITQREQAQRLAAQGKHLVEREFGLEKMVRSVERVYGQVLDGQ